MWGNYSGYQTKLKPAIWSNLTRHVAGHAGHPAPLPHHALGQLSLQLLSHRRRLVLLLQAGPGDAPRLQDGRPPDLLHRPGPRQSGQEGAGDSRVKEDLVLSPGPVLYSLNSIPVMKTLSEYLLETREYLE